MDENNAFCQLVDRYNGSKAIFIADRGYKSYNGFEHVVKSRNKYLIRVKNIDSKTSITKSLVPLSYGEFDIDVFRMLTLKQTKMTKACPQLYKFLSKGRTSHKNTKKRKKKIYLPNQLHKILPYNKTLSN